MAGDPARYCSILYPKAVLSGGKFGKGTEFALRLSALRDQARREMRRRSPVEGEAEEEEGDGEG